MVDSLRCGVWVGGAMRWLQLGIHGWCQLYRYLESYLCIRTVIKVWVVEVGGVAWGQGSRCTCRCEEVEVTADFW